MKKYFTKDKLLSFDTEKQLRALYDLAHFIESNSQDINSSHFIKLTEYHENLKSSASDRIQKINKEFFKVKVIDYQFQVYIMNLERFLGQSKKDYDFIVKTHDSSQPVMAKPIICLLDSVRSAHNVGSFFRNAECFGVSHLFLCGLTPTPQLDQVKKTAMGCDKNLSWTYEKSAIKLAGELKGKGYVIWAIETAKYAKHIHEIKGLPRKVVLIFGHEQFGISLELLELSDKIVDINLFGAKNSLNVSVSQAIVLNHLANL
jgi:23S rRNA (guanosine2251-2'-O)-methyltransferase